MTTVTIREIISISPKDLQPDWKNRLLTTIQTIREKKVHHEFGIINKVIKIINVFQAAISRTSPSILCDVSYQAEIFNVQEGDVLSAKITRILQMGILIEYDNIMKVLIQPTGMPDRFKIDRDKKSFTDGIKILKPETLIKFKIQNIRKTPDSIQCIASLQLDDDVEIVDPEDIIEK